METRFEQQEKALQAQSAQIQHSESQAFIWKYIDLFKFKG